MTVGLRVFPWVTVTTHLWVSCLLVCPSHNMKSVVVGTPTPGTPLLDCKSQMKYEKALLEHGLGRELHFDV